jgi:hypothetical protein
VLSDEGRALYRVILSAAKNLLFSGCQNQILRYAQDDKKQPILLLATLRRMTTGLATLAEHDSPARRRRSSV